MIFETTPAPTVRPPSRMAKRRPSSIAIGWISSTVISVLSPGMTISVPSGHEIVPATLLLGQHAPLTGEIGVRRDAARLGQHLTPLHVLLLRAPQQRTDVVTG